MKWFAIPFSSWPHFVKLYTMTHPSWVILHSMTHSFIELDKAVVQVISLIHFLWLCFSSVYPKMDKRLMEASWWERLQGETGSCSDGWDHAQFSSVTQSCPTLCKPMDCSIPGLPVHHQLLQFTQTHVYWVGDAIQPSHSLSSPSPLAFNLSQHQGLFK